MGLQGWSARGVDRSDRKVLLDAPRFYEPQPLFDKAVHPTPSVDLRQLNDGCCLHCVGPLLQYGTARFPDHTQGCCVRSLGIITPHGSLDLCNKLWNRSSRTSFDNAHKDNQQTYSRRLCHLVCQPMMATFHVLPAVCRASLQLAVP